MRDDGRGRGTYPDPGRTTTSTATQPRSRTTSRILRDGRVVDLSEWRQRRARVAPVCTGICRCWGGVPLGGWEP